MLDLSLGAIDGTHTLAKRGGQKVSYQSRKKGKTSNTLWLTDRQGNVVGFLPPLAGNHNDLHELDQRLDELVKTLAKVVFL